MPKSPRQPFTKLAVLSLVALGWQYQLPIQAATIPPETDSPPQAVTLEETTDSAPELYAVRLNDIVTKIAIQDLLPDKFTLADTAKETDTATDATMDAEQDASATSADSASEQTSTANNSSLDTIPADTTPEVVFTEEELAAADRPAIDPSDNTSEKLLPSVPLSADIQRQIFEDVCDRDMEKFVMLMAIAKKESLSFNARAIGDSGRSYGLWQIRVRWHQTRMQRYGISKAEELFDVVNCAYVALDYLEYIKGDRGTATLTHDVCVVYNAGHYTTSATVQAYADKAMSYYYEFYAEFTEANPDI